MNPYIINEIPPMQCVKHVSYGAGELDCLEYILLNGLDKAISYYNRLSNLERKWDDSTLSFYHGFRDKLNWYIRMMNGGKLYKGE
jgi:hypothetical protein